MRKGIVTFWIICAFLITYTLFNYTLQAFAYPFGNVILPTVSRERADLPTGRVWADTVSHQASIPASRSDSLHSTESKTARVPGDRLMPGADESHMQAVKAGLSEMNPRTETDFMATIERKVRDAQLTIRATGLSGNILVEDDKFQVPPGEAVAWEVELSVYNMRASTGWRYWYAALEFWSGLTVEAVDGPRAVDPVPQGGSPTEPRLTIRRDENTRKTKVIWSWSSLDNDTSSDFPKRAKAKVVLRVYSSESGFKQGNLILCDNAEITYMTGAKRPKETTYELGPIVVNVTSL